ncbi:Usually multiple acids move in and out Transporters 40 [Hibiscus trionum]|uniref:WAT1-related protein n=1 Tax=Hibiscus trionum TaxID=183268 RepID=A0A9W7IQD5_HIBTR|nr:Usually multiple acids move in and out Transporters 40 [Hibiscus trionum]
MARNNGFKELVLPSMAMVAVELCNVAMSILVKAAFSKGMSFFVFTAYCYILGTLVFLLLASLFNRKTLLPPLKLPLFSRIFLLALVGFSGQLLVCKGLELSSATLASANVNLIPAFTFLFAVFFRVEKVAFRSSSTRAKIIGTIASIFGAFVIIFYKGPKVISSLSSSSSSALLQRHLVFMSSESNWILGGLLLAIASLLSSFAYIIQSQIMKIYPEEITVNFFYNLFGTIISLPICLLGEPNLSSWRLSSSVVVVTVLYSGLFGLSFTCLIHIWGVRLKGPVFVASFKPTQIVIAIVTSAIFFGEAVFLGSVIGSLFLSTGLYSVLWGKAKEEEEMKNDESGLSTINGIGRLPLLQNQQS